MFCCSIASPVLCLPLATIPFFFQNFLPHLTSWTAPSPAETNNETTCIHCAAVTRRLERSRKSSPSSPSSPSACLLLGKVCPGPRGAWAHSSSLTLWLTRAQDLGEKALPKSASWLPSRPHNTESKKVQRRPTSQRRPMRCNSAGPPPICPNWSTRGEENTWAALRPP